jgi:DNA-binding transcriptional regulator YiaG
MSQYDKQEIAKARFITGESIQTIADSLNVNRRSVERWAEKGNWRNIREQNAATANQAPVAKPVAQSRKRDEWINVPNELGDDFPSESPENALAIADNVIAALQEELKQNLFARDKATVANSLRQWLELRRKLSPPTVGELADLVIELGVSIPDFVAEVKARYGVEGRA